MDTRLGNLLEQAGLACNSTEAPAAETAPGAEEESHGLTAYTPFISVRACGRLWRLQRAADLETLWNAMLDDPQNFEDERLPYWTELWPSSIALCRWLEERRAEIAGRPCLDLGCGLGLTAMVGQWLGAQVIGMDYEEEALHFASLNARHNGVSSPLWTVMDWRQPAVRPRSIFRLWGGDIMYEKRFVAPVMHFLSHVLADDGGPGWPSPGAACTRPSCRPCTAAVWKGGACSPSVWNPCMPSPCPSRWPYGRYAAASGPRRPGSWALEPSRPGSRPPLPA